MGALNAFMRGLPRATTRIATYSTRSCIRPALHKSLYTPRLQTIRPALATFSTSRPRFDAAAQELAAKLNQEIQLESENASTQTDSDNSVRTFFEQNSFWNLDVKDGELEVVLRRKYDDEDITVSFNVADFNSPPLAPEENDMDDAYPDEEEDGMMENAQSGGANTKGAVNKGRTGGGNIKVAPEDSVAPGDRDELRNEEDEYDSAAQFPASVNVLIQKPGKGSLKVQLIADSGHWTITGLTQLPESTSKPLDILRETPQNLYTGPPFAQLDEEVQGHLESYLEARGIDTSLAVFVPDYIDVREQKEYLNWLERVKDFVE